MGLVGELELLLLTDLVDVRILLLFFVFFIIVRFLLLFGRNLGNQSLNILEQFVRIDFRDCVDRYIWVVMLESTMNENVPIDLPACVTETLHSVELIPL
jgi:hypothetical protein